jgi:RNA polymerase sigma factor (sigma-70 family)
LNKFVKQKPDTMTAIEFNSSIFKTSKVLKPYAVRLTKDVDDANDLLQDTLVKAFLNKEKYADGTNLKAWLYTIMKNTFITSYQKKLRQNTFVDATENQHYLNSTEAVIENGGKSTIALEEVNKEINALEAIYSKPFMMYFNGFKYHEISEKLQIPIGTVKNRIHLARKDLRSRLYMYADAY